MNARARWLGLAPWLLTPACGPVRVSPNAQSIYRVGRFDDTDPGGPWSASRFSLKFSGASVRVRLRQATRPASPEGPPQPLRVRVELDGIVHDVSADERGELAFDARGLLGQAHRLTLVRQSEPRPGKIRTRVPRVRRSDSRGVSEGDRLRIADAHRICPRARSDAEVPLPGLASNLISGGLRERPGTKDFDVDAFRIVDDRRRHGGLANSTGLQQPVFEVDQRSALRGVGRVMNLPQAQRAAVTASSELASSEKKYTPGCPR